MNHQFIIYWCKYCDLDHLEGSDERPAKLSRGESCSTVAESHYATVTVTWSFDEERVSYTGVRDVVLAHPLFKNLDTIDNGTPSPVSQEDVNQDDREWDLTTMSLKDVRTILPIIRFVQCTPVLERYTRRWL